MYLSNFHKLTGEIKLKIYYKMIKFITNINITFLHTDDNSDKKTKSNLPCCIGLVRVHTYLYITM